MPSYLIISLLTVSLSTKINTKFRGSCHKLPVEVFQRIYSATTFWQMEVSYNKIYSSNSKFLVDS